MSIDGIKALTFDTGGTVLDWHSGFCNALSEAGQRHKSPATAAATLARISSAKISPTTPLLRG